MLAITADNASTIDVMVDVLSDIIPTFDGQANQVRCFDHVVNLVAKTALELFDSKKQVGGVEPSDDDDDDDDGGYEDKDEGEPDNVEGWIDETMRMSEEEREALMTTVEPVKKVLVKVSVVVARQCTVLNPPTSSGKSPHRLSIPQQNVCWLGSTS